MNTESSYELRFRLCRDQGHGAGPASGRTIERFLRGKSGIPEDRTFYSSSYFGMVICTLDNGWRSLAAAFLIAVVWRLVIYNNLLHLVHGKNAGIRGRLKVTGDPRQNI